jgi:hypothetical protein
MVACGLADSQSFNNDFFSIHHACHPAVESLLPAAALATALLTAHMNAMAAPGWKRPSTWILLRSSQRLLLEQPA